MDDPDGADAGAGAKFKDPASGGQVRGKHGQELADVSQDHTRTGNPHGGLWQWRL